jgi:nitroimidazol reductase NimA-like FMN-containing flavoprotein (pyridoxamine 5'-phosphate oxidase superfamily)
VTDNPCRTRLIHIYEGHDHLYLHTGNHHGHFLQNVQRHPRVCVEVGAIGPVHRGQPFACSSALVFTSVIAFGPVRVVDDRDKKSWFFDQVLAKHREGLYH